MAESEHLDLHGHMHVFASGASAGEFEVVGESDDGRATSTQVFPHLLCAEAADMGEDTGFLRMPGGLDDMNDYASAVEHKLQWSLVGLERNGGLTGWVARLLLSAGDWIDKELEERRQAIGGIDNMWFLLTDAADFNPVSTLLRDVCTVA